MIRHIVCFKLKDHSEEAFETARDILLSMKDNVPLVREISVGIDFLHSPRSYDLILQVTLDNREALNDYQEDAYHVSVVKKHMHAAAESSMTCENRKVICLTGSSL